MKEECRPRPAEPRPRSAATPRPHGARRRLGRAGRWTAALGRGPRRARPGGCLARSTGSAGPSRPPGLARKPQPWGGPGPGAEEPRPPTPHTGSETRSASLEIRWGLWLGTYAPGAGTLSLGHGVWGSQLDPGPQPVTPATATTEPSFPWGEGGGLYWGTAPTADTGHLLQMTSSSSGRWFSSFLEIQGRCA